MYCLGSTFIDLCTFSMFSDVGDGNSLEIIPESKDQVYQRALGKSSVFSCKGRVENPELLSKIKWWWPDGRSIDFSDSR